MPPILTGQWDAFDPAHRTSIAKDIDTAIYKQNFFATMIGSNQNAIIRTYNADKAGTVTVKLRDKLRGSGVKGNTNFDTNRDKLNWLRQPVEIEIFGNSLLGDDRRFNDYKNGFDFATIAAEVLVEWGTETVERKAYANLTNALTNVACAKADGTLWTMPATKTIQAYCGQITADDVPTVASIRAALTRATLGFNQEGKRVPPLRPYKTTVNKVNDIEITQKVFIVILDGFGIASLKDDPEWKEMNKNAGLRGNENALFSGQVGYIDGSIIINGDVWNDEGAGILTCADDPSWYISQGVAYMTFANMYAGATSTPTAIGLILGATAMVMPMDDGVNLYVADKEDLGRKDAVGFDRLLGMAKARPIGIQPDEIASIYHNNDLSVMGFVYSQKAV